MTETQKELARHALGLPNRQRKTYRNHYVTSGPGGDHAEWMALVDAGQARRRLGHPLAGGDDVFWLTEQGAQSALNHGERLDREDFPAPKAAQAGED